MDKLSFPFEAKLATGPNAGAVTGYGSVFNVLDRVGDVVEPGAFKATLAELKRRGDVIPMLWQHDPHAPIGVWTDVVEDAKGLRLAGELVLDVPQAVQARALLKAGAIKGLSIGYRTREAEVDRANGVRRLKRLDLYEISLVTFPALPEAQVTAVKDDGLSSGAGVKTAREFEEFLQNAGFARAAARRLAGGGWPALNSKSTHAVEAAALAKRITQAAEELKIR